MSWLPDVTPGLGAVDRAWALRPEAARRRDAFIAGLWDGGAIGVGLLELCRVRIAQLAGCSAEARRRTPRTGLAEETIAALPDWPTSPSFGPLERSCLEFAEQYVLDPHGVTDEHFASLRQHLDDPAIATLTLAIATFDADTRFRLALGLED